MKRYICVAGRSGSGKETLYLGMKAELERLGHTTSIHHFSDQLNDTLADWGIPNPRPNQQALSTLLRTAAWQDEKGELLGPEWAQEMLSRTVHKRAIADTASFIFLDGVRRDPDLVMLRTLPNSTLVGVVRDDVLRWQGLRKRADRPGDAEKTFEQFQLEQQAEPERMIDQVVAQADILVENDGTIEELQAKAREMALVLASI